MAKKVRRAEPERGFVLVRNMDLEIYRQFKYWADTQGKKLGPAISEALREKLERAKGRG